MSKEALRLSTLLVCSALACGCGEPAPRRPASTHRVVSLAPSLTEIVFAVGAGDMLVGRSSVCNYPPSGVDRIPIVGDFGKPTLELLLKANPTLVLEVDMEDKNMRDRIDKLGITRKMVPCLRLDDIPRAITTVGALLGKDDAASRLAADFEARVRDLAAAGPAADRRPSVFVELWDDPLMTAGKDSFVSELVALAGGRNICDEIAKDYYQASAEWVISRNPQVILSLSHSRTVSPVERLRAMPGWRDVEAVRKGHVYGDFDLDVILRPGPRAIEGALQLRNALSNAVLQAGA